MLDTMINSLVDTAGNILYLDLVYDGNKPNQTASCCRFYHDATFKKKL